MAHIMAYKELCDLPLWSKVYEEFEDKTKYKEPIELINNGIDLTTDGKPWDEAKHYLLFAECNEEECPDYNWNYRVWNEMPTEEEMKTPWKENPYAKNS